MLKITRLASRKSYLFIIDPNLHEKLSTKGKDLLFNEGIWLLNMAGLTLHWIALFTYIYPHLALFAPIWLYLPYYLTIYAIYTLHIYSSSKTAPLCAKF